MIVFFDEINRVSNQIKSFSKLKQENMTKEKYKQLLRNINLILNYWVGNTYIGQRKNNKLIKAFNRFFSNLLELMLLLKEYNVNCVLVNSLYQGEMYRVLGYGYPPDERNEPIIPQYNMDYVSWSKNPDVLEGYINSKLYGTVTKLEANNLNDSYAIDLEVLEVSINNEQEVVFPIIEKLITNIEYIYDDEDDEHLLAPQ